MYLEHYGLTEPPFRITPHTDFFFDGADRGATLEALIYAILNDEGIVKVSGEVGSGKTMLCRVLMERLPAHVDTIYLTTPSLGRDEILFAIADDLKLQFTQTRVSVALRELQEHLIGLYAAGRRVVILIDEAHAMPEETLEQVRLLSNLESSRHKLLQIVLFGQPELDEALAKPSLRQLKDRITHSFRMRPLSESEVGMYLAFRMRAAGYRGPDVFTPKAVSLIARAADGLTRRINILADKSLLSAFAVDTHAVTAQHARAAIADSEFIPVWRKRRSALYIASALAAGILIGVSTHWPLFAPASQPRLVPERSPSAVIAPKAPVASPSVAQTQQNPISIPADAASLSVELESKPVAGPRLLSEPQLERMQRYSALGQPLLAERLLATRELLARAPDDTYAIELYITENVDQARLERFLVRARDLVPIAELHVIPIVSSSTRVWVVFGSFSSREAAVLAEKRLPPKYQREFKLVPRSFAELRHPL